MVWLQNYGNSAGENRADYKLYYCERSSDIDELPTLTKNGNPEYFVDKNSVVALEVCKVGDQCLCWGTGDLKTLMPDNRWKSVGE